MVTIKVTCTREVLKECMRQRENRDVEDGNNPTQLTLNPLELQAKHRTSQHQTKSRVPYSTLCPIERGTEGHIVQREAGSPR